ncbi:3-dehydroquinate synthase [Thermoflexibacter ruber]|uniref:3-dehydroquinate synthase n=2 Tax=Thermoflexibacter ruber TaxID=1003 RepID=A0A1I2BNS0_9BACT|nr:3-dehydroquinate synthase [Thermoflexibacter ruber]
MTKMQNILIQPIKDSLPELIQSYAQIAVLVDENTKTHCYPLLKDLLPKHQLIEIQSGEEQKNLNTCTQIWQKLTDAEFDRKALLINLGGGVIGDMGGFCAATYKRGIDFIQIPTTLLSQVDASVGGKLGIDFGAFKNHIGVFQEPAKVLIDTVFLQTLSFRELRSGFAEVIKHCLIADKQAWKDLISKDIHSQNWDKTVPHSISIKEKVVRQDPKEKGLRKILNFGHTIGHAVEGFYLTNPLTDKLLHGEAIAIGMIAEAWLAVKKGFIQSTELAEIQNYIIKTFGKIKIEVCHFEAIIKNAFQDKKNEKGIIMASLLAEIGKANYDIPITIDDIKEGLEFYNEI